MAKAPATPVGLGATHIGENLPTDAGDTIQASRSVVLLGKFVHMCTLIEFLLTNLFGMFVRDPLLGRAVIVDWRVDLTRLVKFLRAAAQERASPEDREELIKTLDALAPIITTRNVICHNPYSEGEDGANGIKQMRRGLWGGEDAAIVTLDELQSRLADASKVVAELAAYCQKHGPKAPTLPATLTKAADEET